MDWIYTILELIISHSDFTALCLPLELVLITSKISVYNKAFLMYCSGSILDYDASICISCSASATSRSTADLLAWLCFFFRFLSFLLFLSFLCFLSFFYLPFSSNLTSLVSALTAALIALFLGSILGAAASVSSFFYLIKAILSAIDKAGATDSELSCFLKSWSRLTFATSFFSSSFTTTASDSGCSSLGFFCPVPRLINVFYLFTL